MCGHGYLATTNFNFVERCHHPIFKPISGQTSIWNSKPANRDNHDQHSDLLRLGSMIDSFLIRIINCGAVLLKWMPAKENEAFKSTLRVPLRMRLEYIANVPHFFSTIYIIDLFLLFTFVWDPY